MAVYALFVTFTVSKLPKATMISFKNFKGDLLGGVTAGIVALPLALAFGVSSGLGPTAGLYGAIFLSFFAALSGVPLHNCPALRPLCRP